MQVFGEDPCLILAFGMRNESMMTAGLLNAVPKVSSLRQTFRREILGRKCPLETERVMRAGPEDERKDFPGFNACRIGIRDDAVAIIVAVKSVILVHNDEFDHVRVERFVQLKGIREGRIGRIEDGVSHVGQR